MPAISNFGTIFPGGVSLFDLASAGNGFGRGDSGSAKRSREAGVMSARFVLAGLFSGVAAAVLAPSPFCRACWAHTGNANRALTATVAHQLRMVRLPQVVCFGTQVASVPAAAASVALPQNSLGLIAATTCHQPPHRRYLVPALSKYQEKIQEVTGRGAVSLFQISLYLQVFPLRRQTFEGISRGLPLKRITATPFVVIQFCCAGSGPERARVPL